jgi:fructose-1-phosphate kinase PfkB-like protein
VNPIGSGDAMTAGLLTGIRQGLEPEDCFRLAMAAAVANTTTWDACDLKGINLKHFANLIQLQTINIDET